MARLPNPGEDDGVWGQILNDFLAASHNSDGSLKAIPQSKVTDLLTDLANKADLVGGSIPDNQLPNRLSQAQLDANYGNGPQGPAGNDGKEVELDNDNTHIRWRYVGGGTWNNLIAIADLVGPEGPQGDPGPTGNDGATGAQGPAGNDGADGQGVPTGGASGQILSKIDGTDFNTQWIDAPTGGGGGADGADGREIELQNSGTYIQWRYVGDPSWTNLVALSAITGADGANGANGSDGTDGASITSGTGVPSNGNGNDGDLYVNATNGDLYSKTSGSWSQVGNLQGPAGNDGADGTGVPAGGTTGQVLAKTDGTDFNTEWVDAPTGGGGSSDPYTKSMYILEVGQTEADIPGDFPDGGIVFIKTS